jgi:D-ribose pyranose/furanose isomerase RbsD
MKINWINVIIVAITWALGIAVLIALLNSCSIEHHLAKAQKHIDIAKRKGAVIKPDTVWHYEYKTETVFDTVTNTYKEILKKDSSVRTINNTIAPGMSRQERIALESYYKHLEKMMKLQNDSLSKELKAYIKTNRQQNKTQRYVIRQENKQPWAWVILAAVILIIILVLKKIFKL